jgi:hypothetical protein
MGPPYSSKLRAPGDPGIIAMEDTVPDMGAAMVLWLDKTPPAKVALGNRWITFLPATRPSAKNEREFVAEMKRYVLDEGLTAIENGAASNFDRYPALKPTATQVHVHRGTGQAWINVQTPATAHGGPNGGLTDATLRRKEDPERL